MKVNYMEKIMKLKYERDTSTESQNHFHRYYQVVKYENGDRYTPKFNPYTRKHFACIYKQFKDSKVWTFWCSDYNGANYTYCNSLSIAKQQAKNWVRG